MSLVSTMSTIRSCSRATPQCTLPAERCCSPNIQIKGRGVISGKMHSEYPYLITLCGNDHLVEGITMMEAPQQSHLQINAPWYCDGGWTGIAGGGHVLNVKLLSWNFADGIYAGARSLVSDSFTKVN